MSELLTNCEAEPRETCAGTEKYGADKCCQVCGDKIPKTKRSDSRFCSRACQKHSARSMQAELIAELKMVYRNLFHCYANRDRYIAFDGVYEGPTNQAVTVVNNLKKDTGYKACPSAEHIEPREPKFNQVTVEDVDWATRQKAFSHTQSMVRLSKSFCVHCVDVVIDESRREVRVTNGVYQPIEHSCNKIRVYNLQGVLLGIEDKKEKHGKQ